MSHDAINSKVPEQKVSQNLGLSSRLTKATLTSPLTPLFLIVAILVGLLAVISIPREEEPQISAFLLFLRTLYRAVSASFFFFNASASTFFGENLQI